jgi:pimeloyl-ACP methyl ester carboxylesterase
VVPTEAKVDPKKWDARLEWDVIIRKYGFNAESHEVITEDGYKLGIWRLAGKFSEYKTITEKRPPILLWHGLASSGYAWMTNGDKSIAFTLANEGYDVWLGNTRGNTFSKKHERLDESDDENEFWDFSWEKAGIYDVSATVDFISNKTGFP